MNRQGFFGENQKLENWQLSTIMKNNIANSQNPKLFPLIVHKYITNLLHNKNELVFISNFKADCLNNIFTAVRKHMREIGYSEENIATYYQKEIGI